MPLLFYWGGLPYQYIASRTKTPDEIIQDFDAC